MILLRSIRNSVKFTFGNFRMLLLFYFVNLIFSVIIAIPFRNILIEAFSGSIISREMIKNFNFSALVDLLVYYGERIGDVFLYLILIGLLYGLLHLFLSGGIFNLLKKETGRFDREIFWSGCSEYFFSFLKILVFTFLSFILLIIFLVIIVGIIDGIAKNVYSRNLFYGLYLFPVVVFLILSSILLLFYDYSRIIIVKEFAVNSFRSYLYSVKFVFKNFFGVYGIFIILFLILILALIILFTLKIIIPQDTWLAVFVIFIIQQLFTFGRIALRIMAFSSEYFYHENKI